MKPKSMGQTYSHSMLYLYASGVTFWKLKHVFIVFRKISTSSETVGEFCNPHKTEAVCHSTKKLNQ